MHPFQYLCTVTVEVAIDAINEAIDCQDLDALMDAFLNPNASLAQVEELNANYYMDGLVARKAEKSAVRSVDYCTENIQSNRYKQDSNAKASMLFM